MRKKRLFSLVLVVFLVFQVAISASGETLFYVLEDLLSDTESGDLYLGNGTTFSTTEGSNFCMLIYDYDDSRVLLGAGTQCCAWSDISFAKGVYLIYSLCQAWSTLEESVDTGYEVVLGLTYNEDTTWITNASEA